MGCESEQFVLPDEVRNVGMLLDWLLLHDARFQAIEVYIDVILVSVNSNYAGRDYPLQKNDEVIFTPPIAGG